MINLLYDLKTTTSHTYNYRYVLENAVIRGVVDKVTKNRFFIGDNEFSKWEREYLFAEERRWTLP